MAIIQDTRKDSINLSNIEEWTCGLSSTAEALALTGRKITYKKLSSIYKSLGFKVHHFGITSAHIALLAKTFNLAVVLRTSSHWLKGLWNVRKTKLSYIKCLPEESRDALRAMEMFIELGGKSIFSSKKNIPNISQVISAVNRGCVVILCIDARHYYGINEDWNHYLVADRNVNCEPPLKIIDSLRNLGKLQYQDWDKHWKVAKAYDWSNWSGDMIEVSVKKTLHTIKNLPQ